MQRRQDFLLFFKINSFASFAAWRESKYFAKFVQDLAFKALITT